MLSSTPRFLTPRRLHRKTRLVTGHPSTLARDLKKRRGRQQQKSIGTVRRLVATVIVGLGVSSGRDLAHAVGPESLSTRICSRPWHLKQCISDPGPRTPKWASESQAQHGNPKSTRFLGNLANTRAPAFRDPQGDPHSATPDTKEKPLAAPAPRGCRIQTKREQ